MTQNQATHGADSLTKCPSVHFAQLTVCVSEQQIKLVARKAERRTPDRIVPRELDYVQREGEK